MKVFRKTHPADTKRRKAVIGRLEAQLLKGTKPAYEAVEGKILTEISLTEADKVRINKELVILKSRI